MDMSFADRALCAVFIYKNKLRLENKVHPVPGDIDQEVAREAECDEDRGRYTYSRTEGIFIFMTGRHLLLYEYIY